MNKLPKHGPRRGLSALGTALLAPLAAVALLGAPSASAAERFVLSSPDIQAGGRIGEKHYWNDFGCTGANAMPALEWKGGPPGTKSYALTFYDKDAPTGSGFWHWVAYNIPADVRRIEGGVKGGTLPAGATEGNTDLNKPGFFGPCPPVGRLHHYRYTVYALKTDKLEVPPGASAAFTGFVLWQNTLSKADFNVIAGPRK